ncbi:MAG: MATE family efflux transporter, partial [Acidimicrobiia bacterium]|nr:MATE family efflux transporter [Acidimicrobiia bacterium]
ATRVAASLGAATVAAHQVATQVFLVLGLGIDGLAIAGQSMISVRLGAGDPVEARRVGDLLLRWGAIAGVVLAALLFLVRGPIAATFSSDPATAAIAEEFLVWVAALLVPGALVFTWDGIYLGASRFRFLAVTTFVASVGAITYLATLPAWPFGLGAHQVWAGIFLLVVLRGIPQAVDYAVSGVSSANSG